MDLQSVLQNLGLTKQESAVYLSCLKLGLAKASDIAKKADVKREASYYILKTIQEKGFVSEYLKRGVKYYSALDPKLIPHLIKEKEQAKITSIQSAMEDLLSIQKSAMIHPAIEFYEGLEGYKAISLKLLPEENEEICGYAPESIAKLYTSFSFGLQNLRFEKKITVKAIVPKTPYYKKLALDAPKLRQIRFNDKLMKDMKTAFYITTKGVALLKSNGKEHLGVWIQEPDLAELHLRIFNQVWSESKSV